MEERGLMLVHAYHCIRCNYLWFPRDYDPAYHDIKNMEPPKACARCKSKYWRRIPSREIKHSVEKVGSIARRRSILRLKAQKAEAILDHEKTEGENDQTVNTEMAVESEVNVNIKTTSSSSHVQVKPYEPPTGKNALDVWNIASWVNDKMGHCRLCQEIGEANPTRSQDRDRMFEHTYKRYKKNGWLYEVLRVENNNIVDVYHIGNGAYSLGSLWASEKLKARELKARQTYWKTHEAPRDRLEESKKRAIERENLMKSIKEKRSKLPPEQQEALAEYEASVLFSGLMSGLDKA